jgi:hypothetical protein
MMFSPASLTRRFVRRIGSWICEPEVYLGAIPLLLLIAAVRSMAPESGGENEQQLPSNVVRKDFRTVVLILDSAATDDAFDPAIMPFVSSLRESSLYGQERACASKTTFPCIKSIFEGRAATTGTTLQDFAAVASSRTTWPGSLAAMGLRLVVASDHTLNRLYPNSFVDHLDYETLRVPLFERDKLAFAKTREWLDNSKIDALIVHITGTDKVAHQYPHRGPEYRATYLDADNFVRDVAARLGPTDYLFVLSDHGHNQTGGHTENAVYFAHGPLFPPGIRADLTAEDMLFLLNLPYGMTLPRGYEGQIRTDLTMLPPELRKQFLFEQAQAWGISPETTAEATEKKLNDFVSDWSAVTKRNQAMRDLSRLTPWWLAAAFFLLAEFGRKNAVRRFVWIAAALGVTGLILSFTGVTVAAWAVTFAAFLYCLGKLGGLRTLIAIALLAAASAIVLWLVMNAGWILKLQRRPYAYATFYLGASLLALACAIPGAQKFRRAFMERALWSFGLLLWLMSYFGPWGYGLLRQSTIILALLPPLAVFLAGGRRAFSSWATLGSVALIPFVAFRMESFNIDFPMLNRFGAMPATFQLVLASLLLIVLAAALSFQSASDSGEAPKRLSILWKISGLFVWFAITVWFFEFAVATAVICILFAIWLTAWLHLFARAGLPWRWTVLIGTVVLFITLAFTLNGFQFSHVDFRFAVEKIIPFRHELWRALQLIPWTMLKYLFVLLPALWVLRRRLGRPEMSVRLMQLGWGRQLMVIFMVFTFPFFDRLGLNELGAEEIYFWTFFNIVLWCFCLTLMPRREAEGPSDAIPSGEMKHAR